MKAVPNSSRKDVGCRVSRRTTLKALASGLVTWPVLSGPAAEAFGAVQRAGGEPKLHFLTRGQYDAVDVLAEAIIPADGHSAGARAARVADYVDLLLSESSPDIKTAWAQGLRALEAESTRQFGRRVARLSAPQLGKLLTNISTREAAPQTPGEQFFVVVKGATIRGYYSSEIGIHKELDYKGNQILAEFVGCTHPEHGYVPPMK
jgi:hypothetical protein